ncbi:MAG: hypothetical protein A3G34_13495 [Candidatus Lindowbacteria bacterium RIFCSPLOWO2_12_FULL_62_27]|nr:MAG: hypothetical protein A3G34_13495 [Candidatus Lindowbacteria bacterium RIFCSPLOWO2_12_FULL_62_27]
MEGRESAWLQRHGPAAVFVLALAIRMAYWFESRRSPLFDVFVLDADVYVRTARAILAGDWLAGQEVFSMSPLYPYILALFHALTGGSMPAVKAIQHVIGAATCALICRAGIRIAGPAAGMAGGLISAVYGIFIYSEGTLENEFLVLFLNTLALRLLLEVDRPDSVRIACLAGVAVGLSTDLRPNAALLTVPAVLWILRPSTGGRRPVLCALSFGAAVLLAVLPISVRNYAVSGEWIWTTASGGQLLYIGTLKDGGGGYSVPPFVAARPESEHRDFRRMAEQNLGRRISAGESSRYWARQAAREIAADPAGQMKLVAKKALAFWNADEPPDNSDYRYGRRLSRVLSLPLAGIGVVLPLAAIGFFLAVVSGRRWFLPLGFLLVYFISVLLFYQSYRFRLPAVPSLLMMAGASVVWLSHRLLDRSYRRFLAGITVMALAAWVAHLPLPQARPDQDALTMAGNYAEALRQQGRLNAAAGLLESAARQYRPDAETLRQLADLRRDLGQWSGAVELYRRVADDPNIGRGAHANLAYCALQMRDMDAARSHAARAIDLDPQDTFARFILKVTDESGRRRRRRHLGRRGR